MHDPTVSVIITCYNLGRYLDEAVESVLAQTFQDLEILVVDDGSTEQDTCRLLADYHKPRTRVLRSDNRGLPAAKNLGIARTTGRYLCALDADDRLEPTFLEKSVAALEEDASLAFVSHWLRTFGDETWDWTPARCDFPALLDVNTVNGAALVRRGVVGAVGGFDETMRDGCEDWDLWITLVERGFRGRILPEVLFYYRRRAESMSRLMMRGDGHPRLYGCLAQKHAPSFREHLDTLLVRREGDISSLRWHIHDLELEYHRWLDPEIAKRRDDVAVLERKVERDKRERSERARFQALLEQVEADRARLQAESTERARALEIAQERGRALDIARERALEIAQERARALDIAQERERALDIARERALELDVCAHRAQAASDEMRRSMSWRLTAPLRAVYGRLLTISKMGRANPLDRT